MQNKCKTKIIAVTSLLVLGGLLLSHSDSVSAYTASITTNSSISLDVSPSGTGTSIHEESINVVSDCRSGYNLSIAAPNGSNLYAGGDSTQSAAFTAVDGTSALNSSNNTNKWGYTMTANPSGSTVFSPLSTSGSTIKTLAETVSPNSDIDDSFSIYYGAKVDNSVVSGSYQMENSGAIVYQLTMDISCMKYTVSFSPNGGTGTIVNQEIQQGSGIQLTSSESFIAPVGASYTDANNNTITGDADKIWVFWGWNTEVDGSGDWYEDKESIYYFNTSGDTVTLYAQWKQATLSDMVEGTPVGSEKVIDHNKMQDMSSGICWNSSITTTANAPAAILLDYRGKVTTGSNPELPEQYSVSKLADGNCWMTTNLNLGRSTGGPNGNGTILLTPDDTDIESNFTLPAGDTASYTANTNLAKIRLTNSSGGNTNGVYYTWSAAIANTESIDTDPTTSICPKNWDLPTNAQYTELSSKSNYSSLNSPTSAPSSFLASGKFTNGAAFYPSSGNYGFYWSSSSSSTVAAYGARVTTSALTTSSSTGTTYGGNKYYRKNIRCVASMGKVTINYDGNGTVEYPTTGTVASQENIDASSTNTQQGTGFTREGWTFNNWNTKSDGTGTSVPAGGLVATLNPKPGSVVTLYAQWIPQYTITYENNCMTYISGNSDCTQAVSNDEGTQKINLNASGSGSGVLGASDYNSWTISRWKIDAWTTNSDGTGMSYPTLSTFNITNASTSSPSGITLYAHWDPVYSIQYDGNGASNTNGMGTIDNGTGIKTVRQINISEGDAVTLLASNFKRSGYGFAGWSTDSDAWSHFTDNNNSNDPIIYGPSETITFSVNPNSNSDIITMYAVWVPAATDGGNPVYLQDWNGCSSLVSTTFNNSTGAITANKNSIIALTDQRDNEIYTIAKLADGNCWMVENLRLEAAGTLGNNINDPTVTNQSLSQGYGGLTGKYGNFVGLANPESASLFDNVTTSNSIYKSQSYSPTDTYNTSNNTLEDIGTRDNPGFRIPRYNNDNSVNALLSSAYVEDYTNVSNPTSTGTYRNAAISSYGNYYNFAAATANTSGYYFVSGGTGRQENIIGTSICPAGWRLPSIRGTNEDFDKLAYGYGGNGYFNPAESAVVNDRFRVFPNNFIFSGDIDNSTLDRGSSGNYATTTLIGTNGQTYYLTLLYSGTSASAAISNNHNIGNSVRCILANDYYVQFDANGGTGSMNTQIMPVGISTNLTANSFSAPEGDGAPYEFVGWNTSADGSGLSYTDSQSVTDIVAHGHSITLYAQWEEVCPGETICYMANSADVDGEMEDQFIGGDMYSPIILAASNFSREDYGFAGWNTSADGTGTNYGPNETIELDSSTIDSMYETGMKLYANWVASAGNLQGWTGCSSLANGEVTALTDQRDDNTYAVAKLADGNCWMIENLRLDNTNSDNSTGALAQGYGTSSFYGDFSGLADAESTGFEDYYSPNSLYYSGFQEGTASVDIGTDDYPAQRMPRYNNWNTSDNGVYSYGNYYTWHAAIADTTYYDISNQSVATTSLCPADWKLPEGGDTFVNTTADYYVLGKSIMKDNNGDGIEPNVGMAFYDDGLVNAEGNTAFEAFTKYPNNFVYSGYFLDYSTSDLGVRGRYWSNTTADYEAAFDFEIDDMNVYPGSGGSFKHAGLTIRCLIDP